MINHHLKIKHKGISFEFNWNKKVTPCKEVKITIGKKPIFLSREQFTTLMAVFADDDQMEDIAQRTVSNFVSIQRMLKLKVSKDMKAGEDIVFPYTYWVPKTEYDTLKADGEMVKMVKKDTKGLLKFVSENEAAKAIKQMWLRGKLSTKVEVDSKVNS